MKSHRSGRIAAVTLIVTLLAVACGSDSDDAIGGSGELLPFSLVQANDFTFDGDPTNAERGIFHVRTTQPMICTIVWGETEAFGNFNNSLSMNGTGIIDHDVVLPGAEPGRTYFFRVQGSTADGNQYRSETETFVIPDAVPAAGDAAGGEMAVHGANLALAATVSDASSIFGTGWEPENAIDDDLTTEWATSGDGDEGSITLDLGAQHDVVGVEFLTRSMLDGSATTEMFTVTVDGGEPLGPFAAGNPVEPNFAAVEFSGREVRFDVVTSTGGNVGAVEVRVFRAAVMPPVGATDASATAG